MPRIIMKSPYIKPNSGGGKRAGNYARYIATREGVVLTEDTLKHLPATQKQEGLIQQILKDFPDSTDLHEYSDYRQNPTRENASEFITQALEAHSGELAQREKYLSYIAERPGVEKLGKHGLFTDEGIPIVLEQVSREMAECKSNIWTHIISLRREDAARLGYDSAEDWINLLRSKRNVIAQQMRIKPENFRWYAAFHDAGHHPHVHLMAYSIDPKEAYLTEKGIEAIKGELAREIFRQDHISIYQKQTQYRDQLRQQGGERVAEIVEQINAGEYRNERVEDLLRKLSIRLAYTSGKKQYGYLKSDLKSMVDQVVMELAKDEKIPRLYDLWYEQREDVLRTYTDTFPERIPLEQNIYEQYLLGSSLRMIKEKLDASGIPNPKGELGWKTSSIKSILTNEKYCGDVLGQKTYKEGVISGKVQKNNGQLPQVLVQNNHPATIAREMFYAVQEEMKRRTAAKSPSTKVATGRTSYTSKYALSERLVCGECGTLYRRCTWTIRGKKKIVWRCVSRLDYGTKYCKESPTMEETVLQSSIMEALNSVMGPKEKIVDNVTGAALLMLKPRESSEFTLEAVKRRIKDLNSEFYRLFDEDGSEKTHKDRFSEITRELAKLKQQQEKITAQLRNSQGIQEHMKAMTVAADTMDYHMTEWDEEMIRQSIHTVEVVSADQIRVVLVDGSVIMQEVRKQ